MGSTVAPASGWGGTRKEATALAHFIIACSFCNLFANAMLGTDGERGETMKLSILSLRPPHTFLSVPVWIKVGALAMHTSILPLPFITVSISIIQSSFAWRPRLYGNLRQTHSNKHEHTICLGSLSRIYHAICAWGLYSKQKHLLVSGQAQIAFLALKRKLCILRKRVAFSPFYNQLCPNIAMNQLANANMCMQQPCNDATW